MAKFEVYSDKTKAAKIDGNWMKVSEDVQKFIKNVPFGSEVEVKVENEIVTFIKVTKKAERGDYKPFTPAGAVESDDTKLRQGDEIARMSAVKTAADALGEYDIHKLKLLTLVIYKWIKEGKFDEEIPDKLLEESIK